MHIETEVSTITMELKESHRGQEIPHNPNTTTITNTLLPDLFFFSIKLTVEESKNQAKSCK